MKNLLRLITNVAILAFAMAFGAVEVKADTKVYPGTMCQPQHHRSDRTKDHRYTWKGAIVNNDHDLKLEVVCPIIRDSTKGSTGAVKIMVFARGSAVEASGADSGKCTLKSVLLSDEYSFYENPAVIGEDVKSLFFTGPRFEWYEFDSDSIPTHFGEQFIFPEASWYILHCEIPRRFDNNRPGIAAYIVEE